MSKNKWLAGTTISTCSAILIWSLCRVIQNSKPTNLYIYAAGCLSGAALLPLLSLLYNQISRYLFLSRDESNHDLYRLDHGILDVKIPPKTMWMNMGFWEETIHFPDACRALLEEVLKAAGLLGPDGMPPKGSIRTKFKVIDLGFGCGDQSLYLARLKHTYDEEQEDFIYLRSPFLVENYVGLTNVPSQFHFANERLISSSLANGSRIRTFCADAANPSTWTEDIHEATIGITTRGGGEEVVSIPTWILALDTLYHFSPSREPIFRHSYQHLNASIMAFDLLLCDDPSFWNLILLRLVCFFAATPYTNFITISEYKKLLLAAGYEKDKIEIRDISENVFAGMANFIERRDGELKKFGMGIGRYKAAGKVFRWWARSGIARGCIVVARR